MTDREENHVLRGKIQIDVTYLGEERQGSKLGRG